MKAARRQASRFLRPLRSLVAGVSLLPGGGIRLASSLGGRRVAVKQVRSKSFQLPPGTKVEQLVLIGIKHHDDSRYGVRCTPYFLPPVSSETMISVRKPSGIVTMPGWLNGTIA